MENDNLKMEFVNAYANYIFEKTGIAVSNDFKRDHFNCCDIKVFKKNDYLLLQGSNRKESFFLIKGSAIGTLVTDVAETIVQLYIDNEPVSSDNVHNDKPCEKNIQFTEKSIGLLNDIKNPLYQKLLLELQELGVVKKLFEIEIAKRSKIIEVKSMNNAEQKINALYSNFPNHFNKFNATILSNFIGITRERFTKLKNKIYLA